MATKNTKATKRSPGAAKPSFRILFPFLWLFVFFVAILNRMLVQEPADQRHDLLGVLQDVMPRVGEAVDLRVREAPLPLGQEVGVEHEILHPPTDEHGSVAEQRYRRLGRTDDLVARIAGRERDRLHEAQHGDAV